MRSPSPVVFVPLLIYATGLVQAQIVAAPKITQISPGFIPANSPAAILRIIGQGLVGNPGPLCAIPPVTVTWNGTAIAIVSASPLEVDATVPANLLVAAGVYTVTLTANTACANQSASTTVRVTPSTPGPLGISPSSLEFDTFPGQLPAPQNFSVTSSAGGLPFALSVQNISAPASFIVVSPGSGTASPGNPKQVTVFVTPAALQFPAGSYLAYVSVTSGALVQTLVVQLIVTGNVIGAGPAQLTLSQNTLVFGGLAGNPRPSGSQDPQQVTVAVLNTASLPFTYSVTGTNFGGSPSCSGFDGPATAASVPSWLLVNDGVTPGNATAPTVLKISVQTAGLNAGVYSAVVNLSAVSGLPVQVTVYLVVKTVADSEADFSYVAGGANPVPRQLSLSSSCQPPPATVFASASSDQGWLFVSPQVPPLNSGSFSLTVSAKPSTSTPPGTYYGSVIVTAASGEVFAVLCVLTITGPTSGLVFPHFAEGGEWQTDFLLINPNATLVTVNLIFHLDPPGTLLSLQDGRTVTGLSNLTIPPNGSQLIRTAGNAGADLIQGWAEVMSSMPLKGTALFRRHSQVDGGFYEGSIPLASPGTSFTVPFDGTTFSTGAVTYTALAVANTNQAMPASVTCSAYDQGGNFLGGNLQIDKLNALTHDSFVLQTAAPERTVIGNGRGILSCVSSAPVAILGLRAFGSAAISSIPVIASPATSTSQVFPHFADGGEWQTEFLLINLTSGTANLTLRFHPDSGSTVNIQGSGNVAAISNISIPPNGSVFYRTGGQANVDTIQGWVEIVSATPLNGVALFRRHASDGRYYEGSIPLAAPVLGFTIPFDGSTFSQGDTFTAVALANPSGSAGAPANCIAYRSDGSILAGTIMALPALGHTAIVLQDASKLGVSIGSGRGVLTCNSATPSAVLGLRALGGNAISSLPVNP